MQITIQQRFLPWALLMCVLLPVMAHSATAGVPSYEGFPQLSHFPKPLPLYQHEANATAWQMIKDRASQDPFNVAATLIFVLAVIHTFVASMFRQLSHKLEEQHVEKHGEDTGSVSFWAVLFHFFGEVEAVFGLWVFALAAAAWWFHGWSDVRNYLGVDVDYTEAIFVIIVMAIAASKPVVVFSERCIGKVAGLGKQTPTAWWLSILTIGPLLGSFITEPAAMTLSALLLSKKFYALTPSKKLAYGTLGLLFVNVSVGGTLTHFAAPPILMVASTWKWSTATVFLNIGWKMMIAILISNTAYFAFFRRELRDMNDAASTTNHQTTPADAGIPLSITLTHLAFLGWTVFNSHYPALFIGAFLFFLGYVEATRQHQTPISLRSPLLVGFFLGALVVHGRCQSWWIEPLLTSANLPEWALLLGSSVLTTFNDNAAITYLAAQAPGLSDFARYAVVAGAIAAGGVTVIANAPNPAGQSILGKHFAGHVSPGKLALATLVPTLICIAMLLFLRSPLMHS